MSWGELTCKFLYGDCPKAGGPTMNGCHKKCKHYCENNKNQISQLGKMVGRETHDDALGGGKVEG